MSVETGITAAQDFENIITPYKRAAPVWSEPERFDPHDAADNRELERRFADGRLRDVIDRRPEIAEGLAEMGYTFDPKDPSAGTWFAFPGTKEFALYPNQDDYFAAIRWRDQKILTPPELKELHDGKKIGFVGLSVGSHALDAFTLCGMGDEFWLAEPDTSSLSNGNRLRDSMKQLGGAKIDAAAIRVSEKNPYIKLHLMRKGLNKDNIDELFAQNLDLVIDAADHLPTKGAMRAKARQYATDLMMVTDLGFRTITDVEPYSTDSTTVPFDGRLDEHTFARLAAWEEFQGPERMDAMVKIVGAEYLSYRMKKSLEALREGKLGGLSQLPSTAMQAGVDSVNTARKLFLGEQVPRRSVNGPITIRESLSTE